MQKAGSRTTPGFKLLAGIPLAGLLLLCPGAWANTPGNLRTVVVLTPDNAVGSPGSALFYQGLRATFAGSSHEQIQIRFEPLDISRFKDAQSRRLLADFMRQKYQGQRVDLLIAALSPSLDFALDYHQAFFPGAP